MKKIILIISILLFSLTSCAQKQKEVKKETTKMEAFTSKKGVIIKYIDYSLPNLQLIYGVAETKIRKLISGNEVQLFYQISKKGKYDTKTASIAYEDLQEIIKALKTLEGDAISDKITNPDYLENKFITDDGLSLGYYVSAKKIGWYLVLDKYGSDNTIFIKDPSLLKTALNTAKQKIEELKI
jgi:hypothetical protein